MKKRFLEEQIIGVLKAADAGMKVGETVPQERDIQQLLEYYFLSYGHHRSWQCDSFLPGDRLHKNSYTLRSCGISSPILAAMRYRPDYAYLIKPVPFGSQLANINDGQASAVCVGE